MERGNSALKFLDQNVGPLLVWIVGQFRKISRAPISFQASEVQTIGLLKLVGIGDLVLFSAVIDDLRARFPKSKIVLFTGASNASFAKLLRNVDQVVSFPLSKPHQALRAIRQFEFDLFIVGDSWAKLSALLGACSRSQYLVGFSTPGQNRHFADDLSVPHRRDQHEIENLRDLIRGLQIPATHPPQVLKSSSLLEGLSQPFVVFHLWPSGTLSTLREWPWERWIHLADRLHQLYGVQVYLTGSPQDATRIQEFLEQVPPSLKKVFLSFAGHSLSETIALLTQAKFVVSVDTGIMHLAAALERPVVSLHGPSTPKRWGPIGPKTFPVQSTSEGAGHLHFGFEYPDQVNRMLGLSVDSVLQACRQAWEKA